MPAEVHLAAPVFADADGPARLLTGLVPVGILAAIVTLARRSGRFPDAIPVGGSAIVGSVLGAALGLAVRWEDPDWRLGAPLCLGLHGGLAGALIGQFVYSLVRREWGDTGKVAGFVLFMLLAALVGLGIGYWEDRKPLPDRPGPGPAAPKPGGRIADRALR
jgi:uncharacterized membrane protein YfcA